MKKFTRMVRVCLLLFFAANISAQTTVQIGTGTLSSTTYGPIYASSATSSFKYCKQVYLFTEAELNAAGIFGGSVISQVAWNKVSTGTNTSILNIYMAPSGLTTIPSSTTWSAYQGGSTTVFTDSAFAISAATGWLPITIAPYTYTGGSLLIMTEAQWLTNSAALTWQYGAAAANRTGYWNNSVFSANPTLTSSAQRPNIQITFTAPPACTGTPNAGTASAPASVCGSTNFNLTLTGQTAAPGITIQWQSSPAGAGTFTDIAGATTSVATVSQTAATDYRAIVTCTTDGSSATSNSVSVGMNPFTSCYCAVYATSTADEDIGNVTVGTLNNTSTCTTTGGTGSVLNRYSNYTDIAAPDLSQGANISFSLTSITCGGNYGNKFAIFIDWNQDGIYTEATEQVYEAAASTSGPHTETGTFMVPTTATLGTTGMRVVCVETSGNIAPCTSYTWGETEDYLVNITAGNVCVGTPDPGNTLSNVTNACTNTTINLSLQNAPNTTGNDYQWQSSPDGSAWTDIAGATNVTYSTTQTATTWYRCIVTCTNSGQSGASVGVEVTQNSFFSCYCIPVQTGSACIDSVAFNTINNQTPTCAAPFYSQQSATTTVFKGAPYDLFIKINGTGLAITSVWIDYNQNGVFEASEWTQPFTAANSGTVSITIPTTALTGQTGMRIRSRLNGNANGAGDACTSFGSGEAEDYVITIADQPQCAGTPDAGTAAGPSAVCAGGVANLTLTGYDVNGGISLQWQESTDGMTFTDIAGATNNTYTTAPINAEMWYQVVVTCSNSGQTATSNIVNIDISAQPDAGVVAGPSPVPAGSTQTYTTTGSIGNLQWQSATAIAGPYTDITGATSASQSLFMNAAGTFYLRVIASGIGCTNDTSNVLTIVIVIANDTVCDAVTVPVDGTNYGPYVNAGATAQTNEAHPTLANCTTGWCETVVQNSVWFKFVAPASGRVKIESFTVSGSTDNQLALYSSPNCDSLTSTGGYTLLAANDDANSGGNAFTAAINDVKCLTPGNVYWLQMDGYNGATGAYNIKITELAAPDASFTGNSSPYCLPGTPDTLTPATSGGVFSGPGMFGNVFNPDSAGVGTHTITYTLDGCYSTSQTFTVGGALVTYYADADGDAYGDPTVSQMACVQPTGYVTDNTDCNDGNPGINPGATEVCGNGVDENCDGLDDSCGSIQDFDTDITPDCKAPDTKNIITVSNVVGGIPPYTYSKDGGTTFQANPVFNNLVPGTYDIVVKGSNDSTLSETVVVEPSMAASGTGSSLDCYDDTDGTVSVSVSGGYPDYQIDWFLGPNPVGSGSSLSGLGGGTYKAVVTDQEGCTVSVSVMVVEPPKMNVKLTRTNITCFGANDGSIANLTTGGVGNYTFLWEGANSGFTSTQQSLLNLGPDVYTVTATDANGCIKTATQTVKEPKELIASVKVTNIPCFGQNNGKIDGKASGGTGTKTFLWNTGATTATIMNLAPGTYTFTVTDANGCTSSATGTVTQPASALSFTGFTTTPVGSNYTVAVTGAGGVAPRKFRREVAPGSGIWSGYSGTGIFTNVPAGTYLFEISDKNKCTLVTSQEIPVPVAKPQGGDRGNQTLAQDFTLTPNPARGSVQLAFIGQMPTSGDVEVRDASGRLLKSTSLTALNSNRLSLEGLPTGVLFVTYRAEGVAPVTKRLVAVD